MKKILFCTFLFSVFLASNLEVNAQNSKRFAKLDVSPMDAASYPSNWREANKLVKIIYSRPQLKGRSLEKLAPIDKVWRTGANEAPEITFYSDVLFGGKKVSAGTYTLFTIPNSENWTVILSKQKNIWGSYFYDEAQDVIRVTGNVSNSDETIEAFSIAFEGENDNATMYMGWDKKVVSVPVSKIK